MQYISPARDDFSSSLGPRRNQSLDFSASASPSSTASSWAQTHTQAQTQTQTQAQIQSSQYHQQQQQQDCSKPVDYLTASAAFASSAAYPSPPMSGSPISPHQTQNQNQHPSLATSRTQNSSERMLPTTTTAPSSSYVINSSTAALYPMSSVSVARTEDLYRSATASTMLHTQPDDMRAHHHMPVMPLHPPPMATYQTMPHHGAAPSDLDRMAFYHRPDAYQPYVPHPAAIIPSHTYPHAPQQIVQSMGQPLGHAMYGNPARAATLAGTPDLSAYGAAKPSRKAKGHVASACVPCKKAHLGTL